MPILIVFCLYAALIYFLIAVVGPYWMLYSSLLFVMAVPITFIKACYKAYFNLHHLWPVFMVAAALSAFIFLELLMVGLGGATEIFKFPHLASVGSFVSKCVTPPFNAFAQMVEMANPEIEPLMGAAWVLFIQGMIMAVCLVITQGFRDGVVGTSQPAFPGYWRKQAYRDVKSTLVDFTSDLAGIILVIGKGIVGATAVAGIFIWPLTLMTFIALLVPVLVAIPLVLVFSVLMIVSFLVLWSLAQYYALVLTGCETALAKIRSGFAKCPHARCHEPVPLPTYLCSTCREPHRRLVPGDYGVFRRRCKCDKASLPTLYWLGKGKLANQCPHCENAIPDELFADNIHIPIFGAPSSGKSTALMAATYMWMERQVPNAITRFIDPRDTRDYQSRLKQAFETGRFGTKTTTLFPDAFLLNLRRSGGLAASVYLYDPAGEAFQSQENLQNFHFMEYFDGLVLLIDPLSLPSFARRYRDLGGPEVHNTARMNSAEVLTRVLNQLGDYGKLKGGIVQQRVALVFSKADTFGFAQEVGIDLASASPVSDWALAGASDSDKLKRWLAENEAHLSNMIRHHFPNVRFFAMSASGSDSRSGFKPQRVTEPFHWILAQHAIIAKPLWGRTLRLCLESGVMLLGLLLAVVLPLFLIGHFLD